MKKFTLWLSLLLSLSTLSLSADETLVLNFSDEKIMEIMKEDGYSSIKKLKDGVIRIRINGTNFILYNTYHGDIQAYYGLSGASVSYKTINKWNQTKRLSRAYLDGDKDAVLEADLLSDGGMTENKLVKFFNIFTQSVASYKSFIVENEKN